MAGKKKVTLSKYQIWYAENKEKLAKRRKKLYHSNKEYRERNLQACREWRQRNKPWLKREKVERDYLLISEFAELVGCAPETLRNLERKKMLPSTTDGVSRRRYHPGNAKLVIKLVEFRRDNHYSAPKYAQRLKALVGNVKANWKKVK